MVREVNAPQLGSYQLLNSVRVPFSYALSPSVATVPARWLIRAAVAAPVPPVLGSPAMSPAARSVVGTVNVLDACPRLPAESRCSARAVYVVPSGSGAAVADQDPALTVAGIVRTSVLPEKIRSVTDWMSPAEVPVAPEKLMRSVVEPFAGWGRVTWGAVASTVVDASADAGAASAFPAVS